MRNLRYIVRLTAAFLSRFKALIAIGILLGFVFFFLINFIFPRIGGVKYAKVGIAGRFSVDSIPLSIQKKISHGLTTIDESGTVSTGIAESWETPDKGKTWIFKIKEGGKWQDGTNVVGSDIAYGFSDATVTYPDPKTVMFSLQSPYSAFPAIVSKPVFKSGLLGVGEWKVEKLNVVSDYVNQLVLYNPENKERIYYKFYPTEESAKLAFMLGEVSKVEDLLDPAPLNTWNRIKLEKKINKGEYVAIFFNTGDTLLADKSLRQALSYATRKGNLGGERALSPIPQTSWAYNPQVKPYSYDPEKAKTMIKSMDAAVKNNLNIVLNTSPLLLKEAELIAADWKQVGVNVTLQVESNIPTNYQAFLAIFDVGEDPDQYSIWHSTQAATNITHYNNPRIDKLLEDGRTVVNTNDRKQIYLDFQRFLLEDAPAMFLYYPTSYTVSR